MIDLDRYNVVWDSPSRDASGSMPLGNGDIGVNVWVEEASGDLLMLIGKTDAWDENAINMKLGRVRVHVNRCHPERTREGSPTSQGDQRGDPSEHLRMAMGGFRQELKLRSGEIVIRMSGLVLRVWVDANRPVIRIEIDASELIEVTATLEMWRTDERAIKTQTGDLFKRLGAPDPYPTVVSPDHVFDDETNRVVWCHHNEAREVDGFEINMKLQGLGGFLGRMEHPLRGRTFGAVMGGEGFVSADEVTLRSDAPRQRHHLAIYPLTLHPATIEPWRAAVNQNVEIIRNIGIDDARRAHVKRWEEFWNRSWIEVPQAFEVTRGYVLQRFMYACAGRGEQPIKFNGSIFSVGKPDDPDFRRWGGPGFWFMNQRLIYWPMLAAGDFDLMMPWLSMYRDQLELQRHRTRTYFGHGGAHYPETIMFWGAEVSAHYGWTPFAERKSPEAESPYLTYYWSGGIELTLILWTYWSYTREEVFAREFLVPIADGVTEFFDLHYPRDANGKIRFEPAQALETWHEATNPLPEIAGLRDVLPKLLELPELLTTNEMGARWRRMMGEMPGIPVGEKDGKRVVLPAERFDRKKNTENPELYCVFPYRLFGVGKAELELARDTFTARLHASHECWSQDEIQMAMLGLAEEAKEFLIKRASDAAHSESRFPAFWNAFHDWVPDMDHGGVLQIALQNMLMQCEGREIRLLPAWPKDWDADFRLHAPMRTIVEATVRGGEVVELRVTPEARGADVVVNSTTERPS